MLGLEVHKEKPEDLGYFFVELDFGLPEGGWHDDDVIRRAIERRDAARPKRGKGTEDRKPLLGLCAFRTEGHEYRLHSDDYSYALRRRPSTGDHTMGSVFGASEGEVVGRFATGKLHRTIANLLREAATLAPSELPVDIDTAHEEALANSLDARATRLEELARGHRTQAALCGPEQLGEAAEYRKEAEVAMADARALRAESASLRGSTSGLSEGDRLEVDARQLLIIAELLERTERLAEPTNLPGASRSGRDPHHRRAAL